VLGVSKLVVYLCVRGIEVGHVFVFYGIDVGHVFVFYGIDVGHVFVC
jgi:hypothetical protein